MLQNLKIQRCASLLLLLVTLTAIYLFFISDIFPPRALFLREIPPNKHQISRQLSNAYLELCDAYWNSSGCSQILFTPDLEMNHKWPDLKNRTTNKFLDFSRVVLVISYSTPHYESASKVDALYRPVFADVIHCVPTDNEREFWPLYPSSNITKLLQLPKWLKVIKYRQPGKDTGQLSYECLPRAVDLIANLTELGSSYIDYGNIDGVLHMSDDVILNFWVLGMNNHTLDKNWATAADTKDFTRAFDIDTGLFCKGKSRNNTADCVGDIWTWPAVYFDEMKAFFHHLAQLSKNSSAWSFAGQSPDYWRSVHSRMVKAAGGDRRLFGVRGGDVYYVAARNFADLLPVVRLLAFHELFVEMAVSSFFEMMTPLDELQELDIAAHDWGSGIIREYPFAEVYNTKYEFVHPLKMSQIFKNELRTDEAAVKLVNSFSDNGPNFNYTGKDTSQGPTCVYCNLLRLSIAYADEIQNK